MIQVGWVQDTMSLLLDGWVKRVNCFPVVSAQGPASVVTFTHCWALPVKECDGECSCRYGLCGLLCNINSIQCMPPVHFRVKTVAVNRKEIFEFVSATVPMWDIVIVFGGESCL